MVFGDWTALRHGQSALFSPALWGLGLGNMFGLGLLFEDESLFEDLEWRDPITQLMRRPFDLHR